MRTVDACAADVVNVDVFAVGVDDAQDAIADISTCAEFGSHFLNACRNNILGFGGLRSNIVFTGGVDFTGNDIVVISVVGHVVGSLDIHECVGRISDEILIGEFYGIAGLEFLRHLDVVDEEFSGFAFG